MSAALDDLQRLASEEIAWLEDHPPEACWASLHREWRAINALFLAAAQTAARGVDVFDADLMQEGADQIGIAGQRTGSFAEELASYVAACAS